MGYYFKTQYSPLGVPTPSKIDHHCDFSQWENTTYHRQFSSFMPVSRFVFGLSPGLVTQLIFNVFHSLCLALVWLTQDR